MSLFLCALLPLAGGGLVDAPTDSRLSGPERFDLTPKAYRTWRIDLPGDAFRTVSGAIPIPHAHGAGFTAEARGAGLALDTDGDGQVDRVVEGTLDTATGVASARVTLSGRSADGAAFTYPVRLESTGGVWKWAAGGALEGQLGATAVRVVDLDGNGRYGDVGRDAIVVGDGDVAQLLGEAIHVDGRLVQLTLDGTTAEVAAFEGETGVLDVRTALAAKGVLLAAVVVSEDGKHSFELSAGAATVPVGRYRVLNAKLGLGEARVVADTASMKPIEVAQGATAAVQWGAPIAASFAVQRSGEGYVLDPRHVTYVGRGGEQWIGWNPIGKSPSFRVKEKTTGEVLVDFVFPGSC
jgi:hypothetical protein